jgi:GNAT superfamily N-acetyltransferase
MEWLRDDYTITTDPERLDVDVIHRFLHDESYWAKGIPRDRVERSIAGSICFGLYSAPAPAREPREQVGYARVVSDRATFAYLCDVFVLQAHRGRGLGKWLIEVVSAHPDLQGLRRWLLGTKDAHALYAQHGFTPLASPARFMERHDAEVYTRERSA